MIAPLGHPELLFIKLVAAIILEEFVTKTPLRDEDLVEHVSRPNDVGQVPISHVDSLCLIVRLYLLIVLGALLSLKS